MKYDCGLASINFVVQEATQVRAKVDDSIRIVKIER